MPIYEYECTNEHCMNDNIPYRFDYFLKLDDIDNSVYCDKCFSSDYVKKIINTPPPKSKTWSV